MEDLPCDYDLGKLKQKIRFHIIKETDPIFVFRVLDGNVNDEEWAEAMRLVKRFVRWVQSSNVRYHFCFVTHECDVLPASRLLDLQTYLRQKRDVMRKHLHSSVVVTRNKVVEMALTAALGLIKPTRPMSILLTPVGFLGPCNEYNLPPPTWDSALAFFKGNKLNQC
jgi:hypothetical protein